MSLPPGFLDDLRTRTSLSQVVGRKVMWDARKSNQGKGDMWAPCPFHQEKSASFHVDDRKGFYYCFGCHAKGDAISFVRETENVGFMEAVEILAREAGMPVPKRDPQAQKKADKRTEVADVMEAAVQFFRLQIKTAAAGGVRDYLDRRGLGQGTQDRFDIGFAPDAWQGLWGHLVAKGVTPELILEAGLAKPSTKGGKPYDTFRNRIMFPIRDARGRCTAFGGRAMDPNDNAKYLNSPETILFDKGRSLYNQGPAREAAGKGQPLLVAEGYMDVIALVEAGFGACVAPLGTAITEHQLAMMWRIAPEPIIALDGDTAGLRAAMRLIDLALPLLEAGQSLRFAIMPEGQDPDDVVRSGGKGAMQTLIDGAMPMVDLLWQRETEGRDFDSPERKAALDKALREKIKLIRDPSIRGHYGQAIKDKRWELFRNRPAGGGFPAKGRAFKARRPYDRNAKQWHLDVNATATGKSSYLSGQSSGDVTEYLREAVILAALISTPEIGAEIESKIERLHFHDVAFEAMRMVFITHYGEGQEGLRAEISRQMGGHALESLFAMPHVILSPPVRAPGDCEIALLTVVEEITKLETERGLQSEIDEAIEDMAGLAGEATTWRLAQAAKAHDSAQSGEQDDKTEFEVADNGARISREERSAFDALLERIKAQKP
ncbi:MAG: DNA primase [Rhodobacterales bacterium]|nr:DNA primase [Rhodobacterales bacterium]